MCVYARARNVRKKVVLANYGVCWQRATATMMTNNTIFQQQTKAPSEKKKDEVTICQLYQQCKSEATDSHKKETYVPWCGMGYERKNWQCFKCAKWLLTTFIRFTVRLMDVRGEENDTKPYDEQVFSPYKWPKSNRFSGIYCRWYDTPSHRICQIKWNVDIERCDWA